MTVRVSNPALVGNLAGFLRRAGCIASISDGGQLLVAIPKSLREDAARMELDLYLRTWEVLNEPATAQRVL
jgi:hypothetical protein